LRVPGSLMRAGVAFEHVLSRYQTRRAVKLARL
jgi:hypothetical protein